MESEILKEPILEDFLIQLEYIALSKDDKITSLEKIDKEYKYVRDLLEVLTTSKLSFAECYINLEKDKLKEFEEIISNIITYPEKLINIQNEIRNLYYLSKNDLINKEEAYPQIRKSTNSLDDFIRYLKEYIAKIDYQKNEEEIINLKSFIENIISLGTHLEEDTEVDNIEFLKQVIREVELNNDEKKELLITILENNLICYQRTQNKENQLEDYIETELKEPVISDEEVKNEELDKLLNEMLSNQDQSSNEETKIKK